VDVVVGTTVGSLGMIRVPEFGGFTSTSCLPADADADADAVIVVAFLSSQAGASAYKAPKAEACA
jgi:hypothetical protein